MGRSGYQILSGLSSTFSIPYPPVYQSVMSALTVLQLDFVRVVPMACFFSYGFHHTLLFKSGVPVFVCAVQRACGKGEGERLV